MRKALKEKRLELGLSQSEVAKKAGITRTCYYYIENSERVGKLSTLQKIAKVLDLKDINQF